VRLALREMRRRPGRFSVVGGALTLLVLLLLFLGGLLDGLFLNSTGAIRASNADVFVFSDEARESFLRSSIDGETADAVASLEEVEAAGGVGFTLLGVAVPGESELADGAIAGYELASGALPEPPGPGEARADRRLESYGASIGDTVLVGPARVPLEIVSWVEDTNYLQQNSLWVDGPTWRRVQNANRPDAVVADDEWQVLTVFGTGAIGADALAERIQAAVEGTDALTESETIAAVPGVPEQQTTFTAVIGVTLFVAGLVVALFFALLTLERVGLYAVLKAVGAPNRTLVLGVAVQAVAVAVAAFLAGGALALVLSRLVPPEVPVQFEPGRGLFFFGAVVVTALLGGLVSLRRIVRVDPASALGAGL
jgi:putative ABC transport system permease protein